MENLLSLTIAVSDRIGAFIKHLENLFDEEFPTRGSKAFIELLLKVSLFLDKVLQKQSERIQVKGYESAIERQIKMIANATGNLSEWMQFIETSKSEYTPIELVRIIDSLGKRLYINGEIIIRSQPQYNWQFIEIVGEIKKALESFKKISFASLDIEGIFQNSPDYIVVISFPDVEKYNLFLHTGLLIHEFGHYFDIINNISSQINIHIDEQKLNDLVDIKIDRIRPKPNKDKIYEVKRSIKESIETRIQDLVISWIGESIADLISIHFGGPGAFFAFADQAIMEPSLDDYTMDERYPSFRIRLKNMLEKLKEIGFKKEKFDKWNKNKEKREASEILFKELMKWEKILTTNGKEIFNNDDIQQKEIEVVKESFIKTYDTFCSEVEKKLGDVEKATDVFKFTTDIFNREVFHLLDLIKRGISPNEIIMRENIDKEGKSQPANWASILNAGWLWTFLYLEKPTVYSEEKILKRRTEKSDMLLQITKAIERSEVHKKFLNIKSKFGE